MAFAKPSPLRVPSIKTAGEGQRAERSTMAWSLVEIISRQRSNKNRAKRGVILVEADGKEEEEGPSHMSSLD